MAVSPTAAERAVLQRISWWHCPVPLLILISNKTDEPVYYAAGKGHGGKASKKCRVILFLPPKAKQDIHPAIKWFSNHFIKKQYQRHNKAAKPVYRK
ncbi:MAG: hypothetical protein II272_00520 [Oscillospiraceae bacterium]|nr:hypothetical protein [Oscillospiraceae bacterium]